MNTPDTEGGKEELVRKAERDIEFVVSNPDMYDISVQVKNIVRNLLTSRDTYWKERVGEIWHDLGKYQGWLGGVMGNETDSTLMGHPPTKEVREAKALHTAIILKAKEKVHQTQMKVKTLLDNLK